jgi:hypothetical protein
VLPGAINGASSTNIPTELDITGIPSDPLDTAVLNELARADSDVVPSPLTAIPNTVDPDLINVIIIFPFTDPESVRRIYCALPPFKN